MLFLWLFDNDGHSGILAFADNGIVIFILAFLCFFLIPKIVIKDNNLKRLRIWQYLVWLVTVVFIVYTLEFTYTTFAYRYWPFTLQSYIWYSKIYVPFLFPVVVLVVCIDYIFMLRSELVSSKKIRAEIQHRTGLSFVNTMPPIPAEPVFIFRDEQNKEALELKRDKILFIKGADNYIEINYVTADNNIAKELIRNTLARVGSDKENNFLTRVHRSYLCNLSKVTKVSGNSQGHLLHFIETNEKVPVSRTKSDKVLNKLSEILKL